MLISWPVRIDLLTTLKKWNFMHFPCFVSTFQKIIMNRLRHQDNSLKRSLTRNLRGKWLSAVVQPWQNWFDDPERKFCKYYHNIIRLLSLSLSQLLSNEKTLLLRAKLSNLISSKITEWCGNENIINLTFYKFVKGT